MKILTAQQIREADAYTIAHEPISSSDLMDRAAAACFDWLTKEYNNQQTFSVFCGVGNNGGDGLVIARLLASKNLKVKVFIVEFSKKYSEDFIVNLKKIKKSTAEICFLTEENPWVTLDQNTLLIDAIFGSGLNKPIGGFVVDVIKKLINYPIVSIDIPSGLFTEDNTHNTIENIVHAKYTLTFQQPKLAMLFPQNNWFCGEMVVLPIGIHPKFLSEVETPYCYVTKSDVKGWLIPRTKFSHKGTFGHALIIAGSKGKMGAAVLSAKACIRAGVGLLTMHIPNGGLTILQTSVPEAMCLTSYENDVIADVPDISLYSSIGIGPGIGMDKSTQGALKLLIQNSNFPMVLDADALNILSENKTWLAFLPKESILTPHPKEFERLAGKWNTDEERLKMQMNFSIKNQVFVVLKGACTSVSTPQGKVFINSSGNPGMATGGSGDALTGIITSLLAQGYQPERAAVLGVYLHGLAGDLAMEKVGGQSLIASDIIEFISQAYGWLKI